jgi:probable phosphoglycerate mutase
MIPILVLRHGPTDWNEAGLIQGRADRSLSAAGKEQMLRARIPDEWQAAQCLSSPLRRAMETATLLGLVAKPEFRLIEMAWGEWEGHSLGVLRDRLGAAMSENEARGLDFRAPGGESPRDVQARLHPLLAELKSRTIFVTHKGVLRAIYALATGWTMIDKAPQKLLNGRAHAFEISADVTLSIAELNVSLEPRS